MASLAAISAIRLRKNDASSRPSRPPRPSHSSHQLEEVRELRALLETTRSQLAACIQERDQLKIENAHLNKNDGAQGRTAIPCGVMGYIRRMGLNNT